jgi:hypothetical protein
MANQIHPSNFRPTGGHGGPLRVFIFAILLSLSACEETVVLNLDQSTPTVVIEAQVTNRSGFQYVRLSRSTGFYATGEPPAIVSATVSVNDDLGNTFAFTHNPGAKADSAGYYLPVDPFLGEVGRLYKLHVVVDGETYEAEDRLMPVTSIDSLGSRVNTDEQEDPRDFGKFYEVLFYAKEPQNTTDYYLFKFYRNDSLTFYFDSDIYFADDEVLAEDIDGVPSPVFYALGDLARVEMYSLTRDGFLFYQDLQSLMNNDGGMFAQPPANSRTNLTNGALGFFQVSSMEAQELEIKE